MLLSKRKSVSVVVLKFYDRFRTCKVVALSATADVLVTGREDDSYNELQLNSYSLV